MNLKHIIISASVIAIGILSINAIKKGEPKDSCWINASLSVNDD
jgi:hypothetical protein